MPEQPGGAMWARVVPVEGTVLYLRARMSWHYEPHIHEDYSIGACSEGLEVIRYRGTAHYAGPGSVVILEPGEPHTGGPADMSPFAYRAMYPAGALFRRRCTATAYKTQVHGKDEARYRVRRNGTAGRGRRGGV
jgi:AraC-like protein